jgi:hypothetical protein
VASSCGHGNHSSGSLKGKASHCQLLSIDYAPGRQWFTSETRRAVAVVLGLWNAAREHKLRIPRTHVLGVQRDI